MLRQSLSPEPGPAFAAEGIEMDDTSVLYGDSDPIAEENGDADMMNFLLDALQICSVDQCLAWLVEFISWLARE